MSDNQPFDPTATSVFGLMPLTDDVEEAPVALPVIARLLRRCPPDRPC